MRLIRCSHMNCRDLEKAAKQCSEPGIIGKNGAAAGKGKMAKYKVKVGDGAITVPFEANHVAGEVRITINAALSPENRKELVAKVGRSMQVKALTLNGRRYERPETGW